MNVSLTATQRRWVERRVRTAGYESASEYIRSLILRDQEDPRIAEIEEKIAEGLRSPSTPWTDADWKALDDRIHRRAKARRR